MNNILKCLEGTQLYSIEDDEGTIKISFNKCRERKSVDYQIYTNCACRIVLGKRIIYRKKYKKKVEKASCNEIGDIKIVLKNKAEIHIFANMSGDEILWMFEDIINNKTYLKASGKADDGGEYEYI